MSISPRNPFSAQSDPDRHAIWHQLIIADSEAFAAKDWSRIANDFHADGFEGLRAMDSFNPEDWQIACPALDDYRKLWEKAAEEFSQKKFVGLTTLEAVYARCRIDVITIAGDRAIATKKFFGTVEVENGPAITARRQSLYRLRRIDAHWKATGFVGFLPYPG